MASCLLSSPRIHSPPDSLMRRTSVTKVSENRVFQQAVKLVRKPPVIVTFVIVTSTEFAVMIPTERVVSRPLSVFSKFRALGENEISGVGGVNSDCGGCPPHPITNRIKSSANVSHVFSCSDSRLGLPFNKKLTKRTPA